MPLQQHDGTSDLTHRTRAIGDSQYFVATRTTATSRSFDISSLTAPNCAPIRRDCQGHPILPDRVHHPLGHREEQRDLELVILDGGVAGGRSPFIANELAKVG